MYLKRADVAGTLYAAHFDWLLRTLWWALLWMAISALAVYIFIGWIGLAATVVWVLYRLIRPAGAAGGQRADALRLMRI